MNFHYNKSTEDVRADVAAEKIPKMCESILHIKKIRKDV